MIDTDFMERVERTRDRIENAVAFLSDAGSELITLAKIGVGALVVCAAALVWIAAATL